MTDEEGNSLPSPSWQQTNLISSSCVQDIFGDDAQSVNKLLLASPRVFVNDDGSQHVYYRESEILRAIDVLTTLAKSNFVNTLRPQYQFIKDSEPVYSSKDMMNILDVKEERLRKFRDEGYLGYTKYPNSDKVWYTKKNLDDFLNNPIACISLGSNNILELSIFIWNAHVDNIVIQNIYSTLYCQFIIYNELTFFLL